MKYTIYKYSFKKSVRFRKWSRKAYGIFSSICLQVSIGHVCKWIADSALSKKNNSSNSSLASQNSINNIYDEDDDWRDDLKDISEINSFAHFFVPFVTVPDYGSANYRFLMYNPKGDHKPERCISSAYGLPFYFL